MARTQADRKERVPLDGTRQKLEAPPRPGYHRRWFNDKPGRLGDAQRAGYEFVEEETDDAPNSDDVGTRVSRIVGTNEAGKAEIAYLMEIRQEFFAEDQAAKQRRIDETESGIRRGEDSHGTVGQQGRYVPDEGIKIQHG